MGRIEGRTSPNTKRNQRPPSFQRPDPAIPSVTLQSTQVFGRRREPNEQLRQTTDVHP